MIQIHSKRLDVKKTKLKNALKRRRQAGALVNNGCQTIGTV